MTADSIIYDATLHLLKARIDRELLPSARKLEGLVLPGRFLERRHLQLMAQIEKNHGRWVAKMVKKVGQEIIRASIVTTHSNPWEWSILLVVCRDGTLQYWKTRAVDNRSRLGNWYVQHPTRKLRGTPVL
ncbi:MAG: hypothetical protein WCZ86_06205 [Desulfurivibrionaceae bacterium]